MSIYKILNSKMRYPQSLTDTLSSLLNFKSNIKCIKNSNHELQFDRNGNLTSFKAGEYNTRVFEYDIEGRLIKLSLKFWDSGEREFTTNLKILFNYLKTEDNYRIVLICDDFANGDTSIEIIDYYEINGQNIEEHRIYNILFQAEDDFPEYVIKKSNQLIIDDCRLNYFILYKDWEVDKTNLILRIFKKDNRHNIDKYDEFVETYCLTCYSRKTFDVKNRCIEEIEYRFDINNLPYFEDAYFANIEVKDPKLSYYHEEYKCYFTSGALTDFDLEQNISKRTIYNYDDKNYCYAKVFSQIESTFIAERLFVFNDKKRLVQESFTFKNGETRKKIYEYDEFRNIIKESNDCLETKYYYEYDENNNWIKKYKNNLLIDERVVEYYKQ